MKNLDYRRKHYRYCTEDCPKCRKYGVKQQVNNRTVYIHRQEYDEVTGTYHLREFCTIGPTFTASAKVEGVNVELSAERD